MIKLVLDNLYAVSAEHGLSPEEIKEKESLIAEYFEKIEARNQGFYKFIDDEEPLKEIEEYVDSVKGKYDHIVVLGIGGSSLGTICLAQSLLPSYQRRLHVLDNIDPIIIKELEEEIDYTKTLFIVVTKSGTTPEIISQYHYFKEKTDNFVFITDPETGHLRELAEKEGIKAFSIPQNVGGRFSVLTPVGLLPAALTGINIRKLIKGARKMRDNLLSQTENMAFTIATIQYLLDQKWKVMNVMIPYAQKLIRFADWYRQLLAESIGKDGVGITPINALGVTDQHSQSQLYNDGPNDKFFIFIENLDTSTDYPIPNFLDKPLTFKKLLDIELDATATSLTKNNRPSINLQVDSVSEETLGQLFMLFEGATAFLGEFYGIDAFDQPGVELSKKLTKQAILKL